ncbi:hypothetical protein VNI00_008364 [Paramarasmius palmivorus]|uniref:Armadillo repeat-containing protein 8 n=1 Tax=Paramarasmius palmivorus TaxID=297713 RepID=A0AAW0CYU3_9AGAR
MTIQSPLTVDRLKSIKNRVIGNPTAKVELSKDLLFLETLVGYLTLPSPDAIRVEAAHIVTSLSIASCPDDTLASLLRVDTLRRLLVSLSSPSSPPVQAALARALRSLTSAIADIVSPSVSALRPETSPTLRNDARIALDGIFLIDTLDIVLPLLAHRSDAIAVSIAQLLSQSLRIAQHRTAVTEWLPADERAKESKSKRGWEKLSAHGVNAPGRQGGWVARNLSAMLANRAQKVQEAALLALGALAKENGPVASALTEHQTLATVVNLLAKTRSLDLQLAACLCTTHIIRASPPANDSIAIMIMSVLNRFVSPPSSVASASTSISPQQQRQACNILYYLVIDDLTNCRLAFSRGCLNNVAGLIASLTVIPPGEPQTISDINSDISKERKPTMNLVDIDPSDEPPTLSALREAALITLAALVLLQHEVRAALVELDLGDVPLHPAVAIPSGCMASTERVAGGDSTPTLNGGKQHKQLLALLRLTLKSPHAGVRYATSELMRALTRSIGVLRTNVVDSGLGQLILERVMDPKEDRRVVGAALRAVCNGICEFSPLRGSYVQEGLVGRLVQFIRGIEPFDTTPGSHTPVLDTSLRRMALWGIKNLVNKSSDSSKREIMAQIGWGTLAELMVSGKLEGKGRRRHRLHQKGIKGRSSSVVGGVVGSMDIDEEGGLVALDIEDDGSDTEEELDQEEPETDQDVAAIQEQAIHIVRNLSENETGIDMVFEEFGKLNLRDIPFPNASRNKVPSVSLPSLASPSASSFPSLSPTLAPASLSLHPIIAILTALLSAPPSAAPDITLQAAYTLANLSNGSALQQALILSHQPLLKAIRNVLAESGRGFEGGDVRRPAVGAILALAKGCSTLVNSLSSSSHGFDGDATKVITSARCRKEMGEAGLLSTLKRICESQGGVVGVGIGIPHHHHPHPHMPGGRASLGHSHSYSAASGGISGGPSTSPITATHPHPYPHPHAAPLMDTDREVVELARMALDWLDHGDVYGGTVM